MADQRSMRRPGWVVGWMLLSTVGFAAGFALVFIGGWVLVDAMTGDADRVLEDGWGFWIQLTVGFGVAGAGSATGQWLLLRRRVADAGRWILGGAAGFAIVAVLYLALWERVPLVLNEVVHNLAGGTVMGLIQLPVVRRLTGRSHQWAAVTAGAMLLAGTVAAIARSAGLGDDAGGPLGVLTAALVTGAVLSRWIATASPSSAREPDRTVAPRATV